MSQLLFYACADMTADLPLFQQNPSLKIPEIVHRSAFYLMLLVDKATFDGHKVVGTLIARYCSQVRPD
ncbi:MAG: hypothetical protein VR64_18000 [Desulfatitalea sp. BRH_c12]|nr:MAG: hypothetical protein VR64_18000 [Desulfatitalea sp. BRH_c12]